MQLSGGVKYIMNDHVLLLHHPKEMIGAEMTTGWWFQTCSIFHFIYGMSFFPLTFLYFSEGSNHQPERYFLTINHRFFINH